MREWLKLTDDERAAARDGIGRYEVKERMNSCLSSVMNLLDGDAKALATAWKLPWGNYLINTPAEIVAYCKEAAAGQN